MKAVEVAVQHLGCVPYISVYGVALKTQFGRRIEWCEAIEHCEIKLHKSWTRVFLISKCGLTWRDRQAENHLHDASENHSQVSDLWRLELKQRSAG